MQYIGLLLSARLLDTSPVSKLGSSWAYPCQHAAAPPEWGSKFRLPLDTGTGLWIQHNLQKSPWMQFQFPPFNIFNFFTCWILSEGNRVLHQTVSPALCLSAFHYTLINRKRLLSFWSSHLRIFESSWATLILPLRRRTKQKIVSAIAKSLAMPGKPTRPHQPSPPN